MRPFESDSVRAFLRRFAPALLLLAVMLLAYGLQISKLGFYWDDWVYVYRYQTLGPLHAVFYKDTRQVGNIAMFLGFMFSGDSPLRWHIYLLLLRWLTGLLMGLGLERLWSGHRRSVALMVLLFSVYPAFSQQSIAVVYSVQFFAFAALFLSLALMIHAGRDERRFWLLTAGALVFQALHLFVLEYYFGLELLRPLILFFLEKEGPLSKRAGRALLKWLPYLGVMCVYLVWRLGLFGAGFRTFGHTTFPEALQAQGFLAVLGLARDGLQDMLVMLVSSWQAALNPGLIDWGQPYNLLTLVAGIGVAFGLIWSLARLEADTGDAADRYLPQALSVGLIAVVLGFLPAWYAGQHIVDPGTFGDRYGLASTFGAAVLLVALADWVSDRVNNRNLLLASLLVGLGLGVQMRDTNTYRWEWRRQLDVYWQLYWRAPALKPGTVVVGDGALSTTVVNYIGAFAINQLYEAPARGDVPPIWYINYDRAPISADPDAFRSGGMKYEDNFSTYAYPVTPQDTLSLASEDGYCAKVLMPGDAYNVALPHDFQPAAEFSNPDLIQPKPVGIPAPHIFGAEPAPGWCYYFEKADLARQYGDWAEVVRLKNEADRAGLEPMDMAENVPFIQAEAMRAEWDKALALSLYAFDHLPRARGPLCLLWDQLSVSAPDRSGYAAARAQLDAHLVCPAH